MLTVMFLRVMRVRSPPSITSPEEDMVRPYVTCTRAGQSGHYNTSNLLTCILVLICLQEKYLLLPHDCRGLVQIISVICSKGDNVVIIKGMKTLSFIVLLSFKMVKNWNFFCTMFPYVESCSVQSCIWAASCSVRPPPSRPERAGWRSWRSRSPAGPGCPPCCPGWCWCWGPSPPQGRRSSGNRLGTNIILQVFQTSNWGLRAFLVFLLFNFQCQWPDW